MLHSECSSLHSVNILFLSYAQGRPQGGAKGHCPYWELFKTIVNLMPRILTITFMKFRNNS